MKSQLQTQALTYILGIVIIGGILLLGYVAVRSMGKNAREYNTEQFKIELQKEVGKSAEEYGSMKKVRLTLPLDFRKVCFINSDLYAGDIPAGYPLIKDSADSLAKKNIFIYGEGLMDSFYVGSIEVHGEADKRFLCVDNTNGIHLRIEGAGDLARIYEDN